MSKEGKEKVSRGIKKKETERKTFFLGGFDVIKSKMWTIMTLIMSHLTMEKFPSKNFRCQKLLITWKKFYLEWLGFERARKCLRSASCCSAKAIRKSHRFIMREEIFIKIYIEKFPLNFLFENLKKTFTLDTTRKREPLWW